MVDALPIAKVVLVGRAQKPRRKMQVQDDVLQSRAERIRNCSSGKGGGREEVEVRQLTVAVKTY